mgnify:CR=1 FL=1
MTTTIAPPAYHRTLGDIRSLRHSGLFSNAHEAMLALVLFDAGEPVKMSEAAKTISISRAAMTSMVDRFELLEIAKRVGGEKDRRCTYLALTESGVTKVYNALETGWED